MKSLFYSTYIRSGYYPALRTPHLALAWTVLAFILILCGKPSARAASFVTNSPMSTNRYNQTTTLLPNGKVLVAAGAAIGPSNFLTPMTSAELFDPATSLWTNTGKLNTARYTHTATLLLNGKVLVTGGTDINNNTLYSAELYDPTTGVWANTAALHLDRFNHTATLLPNGQVLVIGGQTDAGQTKSAELYDPATGQWVTIVNLMATNRYSHTATLLPNGKVLVAGGVNTTSPFNTPALTEIYDPATGSWTAAGNMKVGRYNHTATLLPNGQVLVAGGEIITNFTSVVIASAELFNPANSTWTLTTNSLSSLRTHHAANLLPNGKVIVTGGQNSTGGGLLATADLYDPATGAWTASTSNMNSIHTSHTSTMLPNGRLLIAGGAASGFNPSASSEFYDSDNGASSGTGTMNLPRALHTATLLPNGKVLAAAGQGTNAAISNAELYDPLTGIWTTTNSLSAARANDTATLLPNGKVLVAGGYANGGFISATELYNFATGTWASANPLNVAREVHTATLLPSGKVLVAGGAGSAGILSSAELFDPSSNTWTMTGALTNSRSIFTATLLPNGMVLAAGGEPTTNGGFLATAELYDPAAGKWTATGNLITARKYHTATLLPNGLVLVSGGITASGITNSAELYNPGNGTWSATGSLTNSRYIHTATLLSNGKVMVAGGYHSSNSPVNSVELFDPSTGKWTVSGALNTARAYHAATLLPSGKILVSGGFDSAANALSGSELFDVGLGFSNVWRPQLTSVTSPIVMGNIVSATGSNFRGISEASSGGTPDSSGDIPALQLRSLQNEQTVFLLSTNWSTNSYASTTVTNFPPGYALATVFVNGIPSTGSVVNISIPVPLLTKLTGIKKLTNGSVQFNFTNNIGVLFTVQATTNLTLPTSTWTALGGIIETSPGKYQFADPATNNARRFYRLSTP